MSAGEKDRNRPMTNEERNKAIWRAVLDECCGYNGGEPHATTWARGGYRNDVPTLCERCERLIATLQAMEATTAPALSDPKEEQSND